MTTATNQSRWQFLRTWRFWLIAGVVAFFSLVLIVTIFDIDLERFTMEGIVYGIDLENDTSAAVQFVECRSKDCDSVARTKGADPGESVRAFGTVDVHTTWQARDEAGNVLGCFEFDFSARPEIETYLVSEDLVPCP